jgi:hypothetical protein
MNLKSRPPKLGELLAGNATALAGVLVVVEALLALAAPLS